MQYLYDFIKNYITESRIELVELAKQREGLNKEAGGKVLFGNLPYRLFIETDVKELINKLEE